MSDKPKKTGVRKLFGRLSGRKKHTEAAPQSLLHQDHMAAKDNTPTTTDSAPHSMLRQDHTAKDNTPTATDTAAQSMFSQAHNFQITGGQFLNIHGDYYSTQLCWLLVVLLLIYNVAENESEGYKVFYILFKKRMIEQYLGNAHEQATILCRSIL
jgi:hypothetical protein